MPRDSYDDQIAYLTAHPEDILRQWGKGIGLFQEATAKGGVDSGNQGCGCLTQVRNIGCHVEAETEGLTLFIRMDERLPSSQNDITVASLPVFAEWQRKLDALYPQRLKTGRYFSPADGIVAIFMSIPTPV